MNGATLCWLGQMGLMIQMGETRLCVDYFASPRADRQVPPPIPAERVEGVRIFLGTHDHLDHIDHEAWKVWAKTCPEALFVFPEAHRDAVLSDGIDAARARGMNDGETIRIRDVTIHAVAAAHEFLSRDENACITRGIPCGMKECCPGCGASDGWTRRCCPSTGGTAGATGGTASGT